MKRILLLLVVLACTATVSAEIHSNALGLRFAGVNIGGGAELSYQKAMGSINRLELDLGWSGGDGVSAIGLTGIYQWYWNISGGFNWYAGPGAQVALWSGDESGIGVGVGGQVGIEFDFNSMGAPVQVGLDVRPMFGLLDLGSGFGFGGALSVRYTF